MQTYIQVFAVRSVAALSSYRRMVQKLSLSLSLSLSLVLLPRRTKPRTGTVVIVIVILIVWCITTGEAISSACSRPSGLLT